MNDWLKEIWESYRRECIIGILVLLICGVAWFNSQAKEKNTGSSFVTAKSTQKNDAD